MNFNEETELKNQIKFKKDFEKLSGGSSSFVMPEVQRIRETLNGKSKIDSDNIIENGISLKKSGLQNIGEILREKNNIDSENSNGISMPNVQKVQEVLNDKTKTDSDNIIENGISLKKSGLQNIEEMFNDKGKINPGISASINTSDVRENNETANDKTNVNSEKTFETDTSFKVSGVQNIRDVLNGDKKADLEKSKKENILDSTEGTSTSSTSFGMSDLSDKSNSNTNSTSTVENKEQVIETIDLSENKDKVSTNTDEQNKTINNDEKAAKPSSQNGTSETQDLDLSNGESQSTQQNVAASSYGGGIFIDYAYLDESIKLIGRELVSDCQSVNILYTEYNKINIKNLDIIFDRDYFRGIKTSLDKMFKNTNDEKTEFKTLKKKLKKLQDECKETDADYEIKFEMQYVNNFFSEFGDDLSDTEKALIFEDYSKHITETINGQENKQAYMNKLGFGNLKIGSNYLTPEEYLQLLSQASDRYKYEAVANVMTKPESERTAAENQAMDKWFSAVENIDNNELNALQLLTKSMLAQGKALSFVDDEGNLTNEDKYSYYAEMSQSAQEGFVVKFQLGADSVDSYRIVPLEDGGCELFVTIDGVEQLITDENKSEAITNLNEIKDFLVFRVQAKYNNQANFYAKQVQELQEERTKVENKLKNEKNDNFSGNYVEIITPEMKKMEKQIEEINKKISLYSKYCESFQNKSFEANKMYSDYKKLSSQCPIESYTIKYVPSSSQNGVGRTEVTFYSDKDKTQPIEPSEEQIAFFLNKENLSVNDLMTAGTILDGYDLEKIRAFQKAGTDNLTILNYVQNKYGVDASKFYVDYVKDLGRRVIGKEMAQHRKDVLDDIDSDFVDGLYVTLCGTGDGLTQFANGIGNLFGADGEVSSREYMMMDFSEYLASNYSTGAIMVAAYEISTSIGNMIPSIALSFVPGAGQALSIASIGLSCAGNAREEGLQMGMTEGQAWAYGIVNGTLEACLQFVLGGIRPLQKGGSQLMENELKNILIDMGKEAREEMLQEVLNPIYLNIIMNWDGEDSFLTNVLNSFTSAYEGSQNIEIEQVMKAGIYAVITAGIMNSPSTVRNITSKLTTGNSVTYAYLIQKYRGQDLSYSDVMSNLKNDIDVIANNDVKINQLVESLKANPDFEAQFNNYNEQIINPDNRISFDEYALTTAIETILTVNKPLINSTETITNVNDAIVQSTIDTLNSQKDSLADLKSKVEEKIKANEEIMNNTELDNATRINAESENFGLKEKVKEIDKSIEAISNELNQPTIKSTNITEAQVASRLADLLFTVPENQETVSKNAFTKVKEFFINKFGNIEEQTVSEGVDYTVYNVSELNSQKTEIQNKISELESKGTELTEEEKITLEKYKSSLERINKVIELKNKLPKTNEEKTLDELIESRNEIQEEILAYDAVIEGLNTGNYSAYTEEIEAYKKAYAPRIESLRTELQTIDNLIETNYSEEIDSSEISNKTAYDINSLKEKLIDRKTELEKTVEELEASLKSNTDEQLVENIDSELSSIKEKINTIDEMLADFTLFENTMAKVTSKIKSNEVQEVVEAKDVESLKPNTEESESVVEEVKSTIKMIDIKNTEEILGYVSSCKDEFILTTDGDEVFLDTATNTLNIPYSYLTGTLSNEIFNSIPVDAKNISIPNRLFNANYKSLEKFNNLESLTVNSNGKITAESIKFLTENTNIKELNTVSVPPYDAAEIAKFGDVIFINNKGKNYAFSGNLKINYKDSMFSLGNVNVTGNSFSINTLDTVLNSLDGNFEKIELKFGENKYNLVKSDNKVDITIHDQNMNISKDIYDYFKSKNMDVENILIETYKFGKLKEIQCLNYDYSILEELSKDVDIRFATSMIETVSCQNFTSLCESMKWFRQIITDYDLSPVEKLTVGYDILKTLEYKESENKLDSRRPDRIIQTGNIVCSGYTNMLKEIFKELDPNIQIEGLSLTCYEEDGTTVLGKHSRTYALIDDAKYNIHGMFALDPTWDSYKSNGREKLGDDYTALDLYDHFLIPFAEYGEVFQHESPLAFFGKDYSDLNQNSIDVKKIEELYEKSKNLSDADYKKLFGNKDVLDILKTDKEKLKYFCAPKISTDVMMEIIKNARLAEGYTQENITAEMEKVKRIYTRAKQKVNSLTGKLEDETNNNNSKIDSEIVKAQQALKENKTPETTSENTESEVQEIVDLNNIDSNTENTINKDVELDQISSAIDYANYRANYHDNFVGVPINSLDELTYSHLERVSNRELVEFQIAESNEMITWEDAFFELKRKGKIPEDSPLMKEYQNEITRQIGFANYRAVNHDNFMSVKIDSIFDLTEEQLRLIEKRDFVSFQVADKNGEIVSFEDAFIELKRNGKIPEDSPLMKEYYKKLDEQIGFANYRATKGNYFVLNIDSLNDLSVDMLMKVQDKNLIEFNVTDMDGKTITWDEVYEIFRKEGKVPDISAEQAWNTKIINSEIDRVNFLTKDVDNFVEINLNKVDDITYEQLEKINKKDLVHFNIAENNARYVSCEELFMALKRKGKVPEDSPMLKEYRQRINNQIEKINGFIDETTKTSLFIDSINDLTIEHLEMLKYAENVTFRIKEENNKQISFKDVLFLLDAKGKIPSDSPLKTKVNKYRNRINYDIEIANRRIINPSVKREFVEVYSIENVNLNQLYAVLDKDKILFKDITNKDRIYSWDEVYEILRKKGKAPNISSESAWNSMKLEHEINCVVNGEINKLVLNDISISPNQLMKLFEKRNDVSFIIANKDNIKLSYDDIIMFYGRNGFLSNNATLTTYYNTIKAYPKYTFTKQFLSAVNTNYNSSVIKVDSVNDISLKLLHNINKDTAIFYVGELDYQRMTYNELSKYITEKIDFERTIDIMMRSSGESFDECFKQLGEIIKYGDKTVLRKFSNIGHILKNYDIQTLERIYDNNDYISAINKTTDYLESLSWYYDDFGVDQGCLHNLLEYEYNGDVYTYREAKDIYKECVKQGKVAPAFVEISDNEYIKLKSKIMQQYGLSRKEASIIMKSINDVGACSYASVCNEIFNYFKNSPEEFKERFGFDMFRIVNGKKTLNSTELLLDMYININKDDNGGRFLCKQSDGTYKLVPEYLTVRTVPNGEVILDDGKKVYLSGASGRNNTSINKYLNKKGIEYRSTESLEFGEKFTNQHVDLIAKYLELGSEICQCSISVYNNGKPIRMLNMDGGQDYITSSSMEGGGHSMYITGINETGLIVSSWGGKFCIPFEDIINNSSTTIFVTQMRRINGK